MGFQKLVAIAIVGTQCVLTYASWQTIAGYAPGSQVTSHNAIDLDQKAIENALGQPTIDYTLVKNIYQQGGNSKPYAEFTLAAPGLTTALSKGDAVVGATSGAAGTVYAGYATGTTTIRVAYNTGDIQATYVTCKVGALANPPVGTTAAATEPYTLTTGCFQSETLTITTGGTTVSITPTGAPTNKAGRTLQGFSTKAGGTMYTQGPNGGCAGASDRSTDGCPYTDFTMYYNYYGDFDYANKFVLAAIDATATGFTNSAGDMNFVGTDDQLRKECIKKGTAYMNAYMYAIREFEDAIDDCKAGCSNGIVGSAANCNSLSVASVHAWDEGVAFYTGSREGTATGGNSAGVLSYRLAEKRCQNFKTCGANHDATTGMSYVNTEVERELAIGQSKLLMGQCEAARPSLRRMVALMSIPLIQGTLRYAWKLEFQVSAGPKERGEGAVFAAAIVPRVASCSTADAATIMNNMKVGASTPSFASVKTAFENNYACMSITCAEVGGLVDPTGAYYAGAAPCLYSSNIQTITETKDKDKMPVWAIIVIIAVCVLLVIFLLSCLVLVMKERSSGKPVFGKLKEGSSGTGETIGNPSA